MASKKIQDFNQLAQKIIELVGSEKNISHLLHCATRLRFNLYDYNLADNEQIKNLDGVLGVQKVGDQLQIIIGPDVDRLFNEIISILNTLGYANDDTKRDIDHNKTTNFPKKLTLKGIFASILDGLSGSLGPVIPAIVACAFFKMMTSILGPGLLGVLGEKDNLYILLDFVGDAGFYFFPVIIGYSAAKKFEVTPVLGILLGAIMLHPTFVQMASDGVEGFTVFGIPAVVINYGSTVIPIILSVWVMSYVERFFNKFLPSYLRGVFGPALTILVMLPLSLCILGPAGAILGNYITTALMSFGKITGFIGLAILSGLYPILVLTGMHMVLITALFQVFAEVGFDGSVAPALTISAFAIMGVGIGAALRLKNKTQRIQAAEFAITAILAGTSEPTLYGICARYKRPFIGLICGGALGGLYAGITGVFSATLVPSTNFTSSLCFTGASFTNIVNGIISCGIAFVATAAIVYFFGFAKDEPGLVAGD